MVPSFSPPGGDTTAGEVKLLATLPRDDEVDVRRGHHEGGEVSLSLRIRIRLTTRFYATVEWRLLGSFLFRVTIFVSEISLALTLLHPRFLEVNERFDELSARPLTNVQSLASETEPICQSFDNR